MSKKSRHSEQENDLHSVNLLKTDSAAVVIKSLANSLKTFNSFDPFLVSEKKASPANISLELGQENNFYGRINATPEPIFNG